MTSKYENYVHNNCFSICFKEFSSVKDTLFNFMFDTRCPPQVKIFIGKYFFIKVYSLYRVPEDVKTKIINALKPLIANEKNIIIKGDYIKYLDDDALIQLCQHFFENRFQDKDTYFILQLLNDQTLIKIHQTLYSEEQMLEHFIHWIDNCKVFEQKSNLLDVLLRFFSNDPDVREIHEEMKWGPSGKKTSIYGNEQNAHDEEIQASCVEVAEKLITRYRIELEKIPPPTSATPTPDPADEAEAFITSFAKKSQYNIIKTVITRAKIDNTTFGSGFQIRDVLFALLDYIKSSKHKKTIMPILIEEMDAMKDLCSSGYIARFVNVLQGFDPEYSVKISFKKQLNAVLCSKLARDMEFASEHAVAGSFDPIYKNDYINFVIQVVNKHISTMIADYGHNDIVENLIPVVKELINYSGCDIRLENLKLVNYTVVESRHNFSEKKSDEISNLASDNETVLIIDNFS